MYVTKICVCTTVHSDVNKTAVDKTIKEQKQRNIYISLPERNVHKKFTNPDLTTCAINCDSF